MPLLAMAYNSEVSFLFATVAPATRVLPTGNRPFLEWQPLRNFYAHSVLHRPFGRFLAAVANRGFARTYLRFHNQASANLRALIIKSHLYDALINTT